MSDETTEQTETQDGPTPEQLAAEELARTKTALDEATKAHAESETAADLAEAQAAHDAAVAAHATFTAFTPEPDKHILVRYHGTTDPVAVDIPEGAYRNELGHCRERRIDLGGRNIEHVADQGDIWVYGEM